ncbi:GNAT family N-acetyltransferase [Aestuariicoccus sp. MJ-SS9]|uniref:GNAT family N-acetyltransferase n=1 Tax=Aestuariicoccus sp. MJ-SS9 TaxID=3079855 RepID=UPI002910E8B3|nr:GNAT family N-acetyltransferase [Aestuariicoccus sp. MJ-SS9]MDU8911816.1 GNAT family N-acetyltransferase [Aestuariicoccus sp. MJ-SS9]
MSFVLRPARSTDAGKLGAILTDAVAAAPWKPRLHSAAEDIAHVATMIDRGWVTVAQDADTPRILGFLAREGDFIHAVFIHPQARGDGVGRALMEAAKAQSDTLRLWTFVANTGAQRFYLREGFAEVARGDGSGNEEGLPDIQYQWQKKATA